MSSSILFLQGRIQRFWKGGALMDGHHVRSTKKILGFRWSKKAKITLKTISFRQNISSSFFKFSPFLCTMKACLWNLINFSKFWNALIRKEKKTLMQQSMGKEKLRKVGLCFITGCFIKLFNMIIIFFILQAHSQSNFSFLISGWCKKYQKGKLEKANS